jgi:ketol-acid reductoisomerase
VIRYFKERCAAYQQAYDEEIKRSSQIKKACSLIYAQYKKVSRELAVLASQYRSLERELENIRTDSFAQEAVLKNYEQRLALQNVLVLNPDTTHSIETLEARITELLQDRDMPRYFRTSLGSSHSL